MIISLLLILAFTALFAVTNRIRGGAVYKHFNRVHAAILCISIIFILTISPYIAVLTGIGYYIGSTWGWGTAVGSTGGWEKGPLQEWKPIDKLTSFFIKPPVLKPDGTGYDNIIRLRAWGTLWLTFRGIVWGAFVSLFYYISLILIVLMKGVSTSILAVSLALISKWLLIPIAFFACMGLVFLIVSLLTENNDMWEKSELIYGIFQGIAISILILLF